MFGMPQGIGSMLFLCNFSGFMLDILFLGQKVDEVSSSFLLCARGIRYGSNESDQFILRLILYVSCVTGDTSVQNRLSADNVGERDYLRTDGDPDAAGYTIKEAVALSRSVVSLLCLLPNSIIIVWLNLFFYLSSFELSSSFSFSG